MGSRALSVIPKCHKVDICFSFGYSEGESLGIRKIVSETQSWSKLKRREGCLQGREWKNIGRIKGEVLAIIFSPCESALNHQLRWIITSLKTGDKPPINWPIPAKGPNQEPPCSNGAVDRWTCANSALWTSLLTKRPILGQ